MLRKTLLIAAGGIALVLCARWVFLAFVSDATRIRWLVEDMAAAYDRGDPGGVTGPIAVTWQHAGHELDRRLLYGYLLQAAQERDRETGALRTRVDVDPEALAIAVDGDQATLQAEAVFARRSGTDWHESWRVTFTAELERDGGDWRIVRSAHHDVRGTHLGR